MAAWARAAAGVRTSTETDQQQPERLSHAAWEDDL